jgi:hypothetical protein
MAGTTNFANAAAFSDPRSRFVARGIDLLARNTIVDLHGTVLCHTQTDGMIAPLPYELRPGAKIFRFGGGETSPEIVARAGWWVEHRDCEKPVSL